MADPTIYGDCPLCDCYVVSQADMPYCPTHAKEYRESAAYYGATKREDLIDAGLTPKESPVDRALQALLNAIEDTALAICVADSKDALKQIRETIAEAITKLETQDDVASTFLTHFDERRSK